MKIIIVIELVLLALITTLIKSQTLSNITYNAGTNIDSGTGADVCADAIIINGTYSGSGTICSGPLPVTISSFTSSVEKNNVKLNWTTEAEFNNSGFRIVRMDIKENTWKEISFVSGHGTTNEPKQYSFDDKKLKTGTYKYRLKQIDYNSNFEYFDLAEDVKVSPPGNFSMGQNYPNPSNPKSKIDYEIPINGKVSIKLYNMLGQEVLNIVNETKEAGYYTAEFDGSNFASGVYFYRIIAEGNGQKFTKTLKMMLVK
jgi:hypothetical protein